MSQSDTRPTPPAGTPMPTSTADPMERLFLAITKLQADLDTTRAESRMRGEETRECFDQLNRKVDTLTKDDEQLRLADRRLEQRQASTDEELRDFQKEVRSDLKAIREEQRKDREDRDLAHSSFSTTVDAMKRHVEFASEANAAAITTAVSHLGEAAKRFDEVSTNSKTEVQELKATFEASSSDAKAEIQDLKSNDVDQAEALGAIVEELGIQHRVKLGPNPPEDKKPEPTLAKIEQRGQDLESRAKASTLIQALFALLFILEFIVRELSKH